MTRTTGLLIGAALGGLAATGNAATLRTVHSGTNNLAAATLVVAIPAVDMARSFLVFGVEVDDKEPQKVQVSGQLTSPTTVTFSRWISGASIPITWYVAEFASGVTVQRGQATFTNGDPCTSPCAPAAIRDVALGSAVDLSRSFPLVTYHCDGTGFGRNDLVRSRLTTTTNLELRMADTIDNGLAEWQVVEYGDASVQTGLVTLSSSEFSRTTGMANVDRARSWLIYSYTTTDGTTSDIGQKLVDGEILGPGTLAFSRRNIGTPIDLAWTVVEFQDDTTVQHAAESFTTAESQRNVPITAVDLGRAIAVGGYAARGGRSNYAGDDNPGVGWFNLALTSPSNLRLRRGATANSEANLGWFVIEFKGRRVMQFSERSDEPARLQRASRTTWSTGDTQPAASLLAATE